MKKLLALLLVLTMMFAFVACGSDSDKDSDSIEDQAEAFLDKFEDLVDDLAEALEDGDEDKVEKIEKKIEKLEDDYEEILEKLEEEDEDLAEEFKEDVEEIGNKLENVYDGENNLGNATETLPPSTNNSTTNNSSADNKIEVTVPSDDSGALQNYINSIQNQLDSVLDSYAQQGLAIKVLARGNSLAYVYRYTIDIPDISAARQQLASALSAQDSTFQNVLKELKKEVPSAESVIVEYQAKDGSVIYSKEYN